MKITFLGACHEVTGSRTLVEWQDGRFFLVDCGMEQGVNELENAPMPVSAAKIEYVFVTHAHIDHTGLLPLLYKEGFRGKVYATQETTHLCGIMLRDSAHIQESEAAYQSRKALRAGKPAVEPAYTVSDAERVLDLFVPCAYGEELPLADGLTIRFSDIGHLMGSAAIECWLTDGGVTRKIVFSGDVGNTDQPIINDPLTVADADYLMIESTYGDRLHQASRTDPLPMLADVLQRTLDRGGNVIIPSFAVGRTQELLYFIRDIKQRGLVHGHDGFPVYVDSPLANEATAVFMDCDIACLDPEARKVREAGYNPIDFDDLHTVVTADESKALNADLMPKVIISASGMCDAGRIRHHLKYNLWRSECTILFVGYQSNGTLGRAIYEGAKTVSLFGDEIAVNAEVALLAGVSGHADREGLLDWLGRFTHKPGRIFVNHGDDGACTAFVRAIDERFGICAEAPFSGSVFDLAADRWLVQAEPVRRKKKSAVRSAGKTENQASDAGYLRLLSAAKDLLAAAEKAPRALDRRIVQSAVARIRNVIDMLRQ